MSKQIIDPGPAKAESIAQRVFAVASLIRDLKKGLPIDALRIEVDIRYRDGARVKLEGKRK